MSDLENARRLALLALGADDSDLEMSVAIALDALHAEAVLLTSEDLRATTEIEVLALAHAKRIQALGELVNHHMRVRWRNDDAKSSPSVVGISFGKSEAANG